MSIIKSTHESTKEKAREDNRRKPATSASWIQKQIPNVIMQYLTLHRIRRPWRTRST